MTFRDALIKRYRWLREVAHELASHLLGDDPRYTAALEALMGQASDDVGLSSYHVDGLREACIRADVTFWEIARMRALSIFEVGSPNTTAVNLLSTTATRVQVEENARKIIGAIEAATWEPPDAFA